MSLIVYAALAAGSFIAGRWLMRTGEPPPDGPRDRAAAGAGAGATKRDSRGSSVPPPASPRPRPDSREEFAEFAEFAEFPCALGDVVLRTGGEEAWLAGALVFWEEVPVAALFVAPEAGGDRAVYVRPRPSPSLTWLEPLPLDALKLGAEPPNALEHGGLWFERLRRLPVRTTRVGSGAPDVGEQVILAEYGASGAERLIVIAAPGVARVWRGVALEEALYDVLPAGSSTLDPEK